MARAAAQPWLSARDLSRRYGPVEALSGVSVDFWPGEVHAVVGENGAGKTTLMRLLAAEEQPTAGSISIAGRPVSLSGPAAARAAGIAIVHQQFQLVGSLTVAENMSLGRPPTRGPLGLVDRNRMRREAAERLRAFGLDAKVNLPVRELGVAERQLIEIARALDGQARLLILDEPTASLGAEESAELFRHVGAIRERGAAIILIAHNLEEVLSIADRITVLRNGRLIETVPRAGVDRERLVRSIVGRELAAGYPKVAVPAGEPVLEANTAPGQAAITLRRSEILGLPTFIGAGVDGLLARLAGRVKASAGDIRLDGRAIGRDSLRRRVGAGLCLVPGDTLAEGLVPAFSIEDNILLPNLSQFSRGGVVRRRALRKAVEGLIAELDIRPADPTIPVRRLSGGNRQKVAIAKWLASGARVFLMDDPTKAVDVGAKAEIYRLLGEVVQDGGAVLLVSSDLDELVGLSDRVVVLRASEVVATFDTPLAKEALLAATAGRRHPSSAEAVLQ